LIKDYNCNIDYYPRKANVFTNALRRKDKAIIGGPTTWDEKTLIELKRLGEVLNVSPKWSLIAQLKVKLGYWEQILEAQQLDDQVLKVGSKLKSGSETLFRMEDDGIVVLGWHMYVPDNKVFKQKLLQEAYKSKFTLHPGNTD